MVLGIPTRGRLPTDPLSNQVLMNDHVKLHVSVNWGMRSRVAEWLEAHPNRAPEDWDDRTQPRTRLDAAGANLLFLLHIILLPEDLCLPKPSEDARLNSVFEQITTAIARGEAGVDVDVPAVVPENARRNGMLVLWWTSLVREVEAVFLGDMAREARALWTSLVREVRALLTFWPNPRVLAQFASRQVSPAGDPLQRFRARPLLRFQHFQGKHERNKRLANSRCVVALPSSPLSDYGCFTRKFSSPTLHTWRTCKG
jgi:hypothetical protein